MKRCTVLLFMIFSLFKTLSASSYVLDTLQSSMLFKEYTEGKIFLKEGKLIIAHLNYNLITESMNYLDTNGDVLSLKSSSKINYILINGRIFVPYIGVFLEIPEINGIAKIGIRNRAILITDAVGVYGGRNTTGSVTSLNNITTDLTTSSQTNKINANVVSELNYKTDFYLVRDKKCLYISGHKTFSKLFREINADNIKTYIEQNELNLDNRNDLIQIARWINLQLNKNN